MHSATFLLLGYTAFCLVVALPVRETHLLKRVEPSIRAVKPVLVHHAPKTDVDPAIFHPLVDPESFTPQVLFPRADGAEKRGLVVTAVVDIVVDVVDEVKRALSSSTRSITGLRSARKRDNIDTSTDIREAHNAEEDSLLPKRESEKRAVFQDLGLPIPDVDSELEGAVVGLFGPVIKGVLNDSPVKA